MKYNKPPESYGCRCDALTKSGERCRRTNYDLYPTRRSPGEKSKPVRLCRQHAAIRDEMIPSNKRLPLIEGGFLGGWNEYGYGNMVTCEEDIDWDNVEKLTIPKYWAEPEEGRY